VPTSDKRHRDAGDDGGRQVAQEQEDHHHHQRDGQHQLELHVLHRGADGVGPVGQNGFTSTDAGSVDVSCGSSV
jgi:hypothetical protein